MRDQLCTHWPLNSAAQIDSASAALRAVLRLWDRAAELSGANRDSRSGCLDPSLAVDDARGDVLMLQAAVVPDSVQRLRLALSTLADDFEKISHWLVKSAQDTCDAKKMTEHAYAKLTILRDDHRVIARDWLGADMNALIAWLLHRAVGVINRLDLSPDAIAADLLSTGSYKPAIESAAVMLERAGALAAETELFVDNFDRQWRGLRDQMASVIAMSPAAAAPAR